MARAAGIATSGDAVHTDENGDKAFLAGPGVEGPQNDRS